MNYQATESLRRCRFSVSRSPQLLVPPKDPVQALVCECGLVVKLAPALTFFSHRASCTRNFQCPSPRRNPDVYALYVVADGGFAIKGICPLLSSPAHPPTVVSLFNELSQGNASAGLGVMGMDVKGISSFLHGQDPDSRAKCHKMPELQLLASAAQRGRVRQSPSEWSHGHPLLAAWAWERLPRAYANFPVIWSSPSHAPQDLRVCVY